MLHSEPGASPDLTLPSRVSEEEGSSRETDHIVDTTFASIIFALRGRRASHRQDAAPDRGGDALHDGTY